MWHAWILNFQHKNLGWKRLDFLGGKKVEGGIKVGFCGLEDGGRVLRGYGEDWGGSGLELWAKFLDFFLDFFCEFN